MVSLILNGSNNNNNLSLADMNEDGNLNVADCWYLALHIYGNLLYVVLYP